jgi:hypothetical protein
MNTSAKTDTIAERQEREREELNTKHATERANLIIEHGIVAALPADLTAAHAIGCHVHRLYDQDASLTVKHERFEVLRKDKTTATSETLRRLASAFPILPACKYTDGSTGFRTATNAAAELTRAETKGREPLIEPIAPVLVRFEPADYSQTIRVQWFAEIAGRIVRVEVEYPIHSPEAVALGTVDVRYHYNRQTGDVIDATVINNSREYTIRYWHPPTSAGDHYVYWDSCNGEHGNVSPADLADIMDAAAKDRGNR